MAKIPPGPKDIMINGKVVGQYISTGDTELDVPIARARMKELGIESPEQPMWKLVRQQAIDFQNTCALLWKTELQRQPTERPYTLVPYMVNSAFCVELYLKALGLKHGVQIRSRKHELLDLYRQLPPQAHADIQASVADALKDAPVQDEVDVEQFMTAMNDVFPRWRYAYEHEEVGQQRMDIVRFLRMLMFYACRNEVPPLQK